MRGKPGVHMRNLLLVPGALFFSMLTGADVMQSMVLLLKKDDYYDLTAAKAASVSANSLSYAMIIAVPVVLVIGFLYDLIGRRATTVTTFVIGALATIAFPLVSPSVIAYDVARVFFVQTLIIMLSNPFINDYVTVQSRGIATGFQTIGLTIGNLLSVGGLYTLTNMFKN